MGWLVFGAMGLGSGLLSGLLGIGGGSVMVPFLIALHYSPTGAIATSSWAITLTAIAGTWQNQRQGYLQWGKILRLGVPALVVTQGGVWIAHQLPGRWLLICFGLLLLGNLGLDRWRHNLKRTSPEACPPPSSQPAIAQIATGSAGGLLAGLFGVGGGVIMVPLQMVLLGEAIKPAIQTSLAVIVITAISATLGHSANHLVDWHAGSLLGLGGAIGASSSTHLLPKLPDRWVMIGFQSLCIILAIYMFYRAQLGA